MASAFAESRAETPYIRRVPGPERYAPAVPQTQAMMQAQAEEAAKQNGRLGYYHEREPDAYYYSQAPQRSYYYSGGYADPYGYQTPRAYDIYRNAVYGDPSPYDEAGYANAQVRRPPAPGVGPAGMYPSVSPSAPPQIAGQRTAPMEVQPDPDPESSDRRKKGAGWYIAAGAGAAAIAAGAIAIAASGGDDDGAPAPSAPKQGGGNSVWGVSKNNPPASTGQSPGGSPWKSPVDAGGVPLKDTPASGGNAPPPADNGTPAPPPADNGTPAPPPADNGTPAPPPADNGTPAPPPADNGTPTPPPADNGTPTPPPADNGTPTPPPADNGTPTPPPADNGTPTPPPADNGTPTPPPADNGTPTGALPGDQPQKIHPFAENPGNFKTEEAGRNPALGMINAYDAYAKGYTGEIFERDASGVLKDSVADGKVKVGVIDGKIDFDDEDLAGAIIKDESVTCTMEGGCKKQESDGVAAPLAHGTVVAKILAARKNQNGAQGVAYRAELVTGRFLDIDGGSDVQAISEFLNKDVKVINGSYGFLEDGLFNGKPTQKISLPIISDSHTDAAYSPEKLASGLYSQERGMNYISVFRRLIQQDVAMVYAGGNNPTDNPAALAALPYFFRGDMTGRNDVPEGYNIVNPGKLDFSKHWVAVVALDNQGKIASYSGRCGVAKDWCISAPGDYRAFYGKEAIGTSYAAPSVSGAVALMRGAFPHLKAPQVLNILFSTAKDLGDPGVDAIYGHGLVDLNKATSPSEGGWKLTTGGRYDGATVALALSQLNLPAAAGDAGKRAALGSVTFLDEYNRNFTVRADHLVRGAGESAAFASEKRLSEFAAPVKVTSSELTEGVRLVSSQKSLTALPAMTEDGMGGGGGRSEQAFMLETEMRPSKNTRVILRQGKGAETADLLAAPEGREASEEAAVRELARGGMYGAFASGFADLVRSGASAAAVRQAGALRLGYAMTAGKTGERDTFDPYARDEGGHAQSVTAAADWQRGAAGFSASAGVIREQEGALGGRRQGAFALGSDASTSYFSAGVRYRLGAGAVAAAQYQYGVTAASPMQGGLAQNVGQMSSDAFSMGVLFEGVAAPRDRLGITLSQPLRVRSGALNLRLPDSISADGTMNYRNETASLTPSGRELALEVHYTVNSDDGKHSLTAGAGVRANPGHDASAAPAVDVLMKYRHEF